MKKIMAALAVFTLFAGNIFADFNWSFYGRGVFTPYAASGEDSSISAATTTYDNKSRPRIGFTLRGNNEVETIGMNAVFNWDGKSGDATSLIGENANMWVRPWEFVKLIIGKFEVDDFRGRIGAAEFSSWILPDGSKDEDAVFTRFKANAGAHLTLKPLAWLDSNWNGLSIEAALGSNYSGERAIRNIIGWSAADVFKAGQIGIGYRFSDIGLARVQYIGNNRKVYIEDYLYKGNPDNKFRLTEGLSTNYEADLIEAAFLFDKIENLKAEVGIKFPVKFNTDFPEYQYYPAVYANNTPYQNSSIQKNNDLEIQLPKSLTIGASYKWNYLDVLFRTDISWGGKYIDKGEGDRTITEGMGLGIMASASYRFLEKFRGGLDIGFNFHEKDKIETGHKIEYIGERAKDVVTSIRKDFGFAPWVSMDLGGGVIKLGVALMMPSSERWNYSTPSVGGDDGFRQIYSGLPIVSIPISVTYSF